MSTHRTVPSLTVLLAAGAVPFGIAAANYADGPAAAVTHARVPAGAYAPATGSGYASGTVPGGQGSVAAPDWGRAGSSGSGWGSNGSGSRWGSGWGRSGSFGGQAVTNGIPVASAKGVVLVDTLVPGGQGAGTGITLTPDGTVLTNYHVVEGSTSVRVTDTTTGRTFTATVVGHDASHDIAVLRLQGASGLSTAVINRTMPGIGDTVTAVGQGGGQGRLYAAQGSVTSTNEHITAGDESDPTSSERLTGLIETSADVVPGYSGGPLLDAQGRVVGIDTAASGGPDVNGYAVPSATAMSVVDQIRSGQRTSSVHVGPRAGLGITVSGGAQVEGASVVEVLPGSAAQSAGVTAGSVITAVDGRAVTSAADLTTMLSTDYPGTTVRLTWTDADGGAHTKAIVLGTSQAN